MRNIDLVNQNLVVLGDAPLSLLVSPAIYTWEEYLDHNPDKRAWAKSNPQLAQKAKICPSI